MNFDLKAIAKAAQPATITKAQAETAKGRRQTAYIDYLARHGYDNRNGNAGRIAGYMALYREDLAPRGLCLYGPVGRGKSLALAILSRWTSPVQCITANQAISAYKRGEDSFGALCEPDARYIEGRNRVPDLVVDDLGREEVLMHFGQRIDVCALLITRRYELWQATGARLHIATNLIRTADPKHPDTPHIEGRYGERIVSRLDDMCWFMSLAGPDRRRDGK